MESVEGLLARADVPVVAADEHGFITFANEAFEREYGWSRKEALGRHLTLIIPPHMRETHLIGFSRFLSSESSTLLGRPLRLPVLCRDGRERPAEHLIVGEKREGRWRFAALLTPAGGW